MPGILPIRVNVASARRRSKRSSYVRGNRILRVVALVTNSMLRHLNSLTKPPALSAVKHAKQVDAKQQRPKHFLVYNGGPPGRQPTLQTQIFVVRLVGVQRNYGIAPSLPRRVIQRVRMDKGGRLSRLGSLACSKRDYFAAAGLAAEIGTRLRSQIFNFCRLISVS